MNQLDKELQRAIDLDDYKDYGVSTKKTQKKQMEYFHHFPDWHMAVISGNRKIYSKKLRREADEDMEDNG